MQLDEVAFVHSVFQAAVDNFPMLAEQAEVQQALRILNTELSGEVEDAGSEPIEVQADSEATEESDSQV